MQSKSRSLRRDTKAASPAVSMVIITAATVVLVLVSSGYALQVLWRQQATAEFDAVQNSLSSFDDALRDIAWDRGGSRSVRFTTNYGNMRLIDSSKEFTISAIGLNDTFSYEFTTSAVKYQMPYGYGYNAGTSGNESPYILGDEKTVVSRLTDSFGQALVEQNSDFTSITLNYRVRVSEEGPIKTLEPSKTTVNYVDIFVIRLKCVSSEIGAGDFDLVCKNIGLDTKSYGVYSIAAATGAHISVSDGTEPVGTEPDSINLADLSLNYGDNVVLNLIVADVRVST